MNIRFFIINNLSDIGTGNEVYLDTVDTDVVPTVDSDVGLFDGFSRKVANVTYYYDKDGVNVEVMLYTNLMFENGKEV